MWPSRRLREVGPRSRKSDQAGCARGLLELDKDGNRISLALHGTVPAVISLFCVIWSRRQVPKAIAAAGSSANCPGTRCATPSTSTCRSLSSDSAPFPAGVDAGGRMPSKLDQGGLDPLASRLQCCDAGTWSRSSLVFLQSSPRLSSHVLGSHSVSVRRPMDMSVAPVMCEEERRSQQAVTRPRSDTDPE